MSSFLCAAGQGACMRRYKCQHFIDGIYAADRSHAGLHKVRGFGDECTDFKEVESARLLREAIAHIKACAPYARRSTSLIGRGIGRDAEAFLTQIQELEGGWGE